MDESERVRNEITDFIIDVSEDAAKREAFAKDRDAFLAGTSLSEQAKKILRGANQRLILGSAQRMAIAVIVLILETVTTEVTVIVAPALRA